MRDSKKNVNKVVLAYSGGLDTSIILKWLQEEYDCEVVTFTADLGQGEELEPARKKAEMLGIKEIYIEDLREEFVRDFVFPMFRANALYEGIYLLGTSIARPLISKRLVELAQEHGADAVAHGATGKGNDQCRFELSYMALDPKLNILAPWKMDEFREAFPGRAEMIAYCKKHKIPVEASLKKSYSMDRNLLHISYEAGILEDPWFDPTTKENKGMFKLSVAPEDAPNKAEYVELDFVKGDCVALNGKKLTPGRLLKALNKLGGKHGIGRIDIVENRLVGMKSRGCYETPGGTVLLKAYKALETMVLDKAALKYREQIGLEFSHVMYDGRWFTALNDALLAGAASFAKKVTGEIVVKLYKGQATVTQRQSPNSLYSEDFATFGADDVYDQKHAEGFIRLFSLSSRIEALKKQGEQ